MEYFYCMVVSTCYGDNENKAQNAECWYIVCVMLHDFIQATRKERVGLEAYYSAIYPNMRVNQFLENPPGTLSNR